MQTQGGSGETGDDATLATGSGLKAIEEINSNATPQRGRLVVVSGPSGVGKDAVLGRVYRADPTIVRSVSATTRPPRKGEADGIDYHFLAHSEFEEQITQGYFLEYARYGPNLYGTPRHKVEAKRDEGLDVVLKIEVQGAAQIRTLVPDALLIFIKPPSMEILEQRLRGRGTDPEARIQERLAAAQHELQQLFLYDYAITNDDLQTASEVFAAIVQAERAHTRRRNPQP